MNVDRVLSVLALGAATTGLLISLVLLYKEGI